MTRRLGVEHQGDMAVRQELILKLIALRCQQKLNQTREQYGEFLSMPDLFAWSRALHRTVVFRFDMDVVPMPSVWLEICKRVATSTGDPGWRTAFEIARAVGMRQELQVSQKMLADQIGVSKSTLTDWEHLRKGRQLSTLQRYIRGLGGRLQMDLVVLGEI